MSRTVAPHLRTTHPSFKPVFSTPIRLASLAARPENWKAAAPAAIPDSQTYAAQASLPRLPVPELPETLSKLKESLKPIAWSEEEYNAVANKVDEFAKGKGPELQTRLKEWANGREHWLEEWWDDGGYLGYRDSVVVNVSYYYGFDAHPAHLEQTPAARAAALARGTMLFRQKLKLGQVTPEGTKEGPFCMDTYRWMFDCCRLPGPHGLDWSASYAKEGDTGTEDAHIIVFRRNRPYKVVAATGGRILSMDEFQKQIQEIYDTTKTEYPGVGVLSASNRDVWAKDYTELSSSAHNSTILHAIQSAAFTISLDTAKPNEPVSFSRDLWHGELASNSNATGLKNRWVDKPCEYVVFDNGKAGFMGEHSAMDGTPTVRLCDEVLDMIASPDFDSGTGNADLKPVPLDWEISNKTKESIDQANEAARALISSQELGFYETPYGKNAIKKFGVSPDSWAQMIVQLAYRRLLDSHGWKRNGGTYEAATTRKFYKGRTEAIRVVTSESDAWVRSMIDGASKEEKRRLFGLAAKRHIELAKMCGSGKGIDRHLLGLKKVLKQGEEAPALFSDPVFTRSSNWVLSTSAVFSKHFDVYGWGEVVPDGFGVAYMTGFNDKLMYTITSRTEMPNAEFVKEIAKAADDLYKLHADGSERKPKL
ncbi:carnitine acetyl transferase [Moniliophthora roreri MCA 2997]|uniref:Carnitine acetyl transferase n=2 Tax=Moniliophthora roreri TaxID=221103 RepID=V2XF51_MONRO|nr:carnitine acetyl transferase [Moniliophthora roreri MCA 2997]